MADQVQEPTSMLPGNEVPPTTETTTPTTPTTPAAQQSQTQTPSATTITKPEGTPTSETSWLESLPEALRGNEKLKNFKTADEAIQSLLDSSTPKTIEPTAYKIPDAFPVKDIGVWASKMNLTQEQLDGIIALDGHMKKTEAAATDKVMKAELEKVLSSWGPEKDANVRNATSVIRHFDENNEMVKLLDDTGAGNHPVVVKFFAKMGKALMAEGGFIKGSGAGNTADKSVASTIFDKR